MELILVVAALMVSWMKTWMPKGDIDVSCHRPEG